MAWKKGTSGNPNGRAKDKLIGDALRLAVNEPGADGRKKLRHIVEKTVDLAMAGEPWAVNFVADRLDGKPSQSIDATITDERNLSELSSSELVARIDAALARAADASEGADGAGSSETPSSDVRQLN